MNRHMERAWGQALITTAHYLDTQQYSIHYTDYDWSLNEQRDGLGHETS